MNFISTFKFNYPPFHKEQKKLRIEVQLGE